MSGMSDEDPLPPLWLQKKVLEKLTSGQQKGRWVSAPESGCFCLLNSESELICTQVVQGESTLKITGRVGIPEGDPVIQLAATIWKGVIQLVTSHRSSLLRLWTGTDLSLQASFKSQHLGPTILMEFSPSSGTLFTASASGNMSIKAWNFTQQQCLQTFRPLTSRPMVLRAFQKESEEDEFIAVGTVEGTILVWKRGEDKPSQLQKHVSPVSCLEYAHGRLISGGRDQILVIWNTNNWQPLKILPTFENVNTMSLLGEHLRERFGVLNPSDDIVLTGGQDGRLRLWNVTNFCEVETEALKSWPLSGLAVSNIYCTMEFIVFQQEDIAFVANSNVQAYPLNEFEVTDMCLVAEKYLIVATASPILKCFDTESQMEMTVTTTPDEVTLLLSSCRKSKPYFASTGRDKNIRLWKLSLKSKEIKHLTTLSGHSSSVKALALLDTAMFSADADGVLKLWSLDPTMKLGTTINTRICHDKEVTAMDINLNKGLLVSGSLDKMVKLFGLEHLNQVSCLKGHRRGISCVKFSDYDHILASGSSDMVIKLWHTTTFSCLQTIEGLSGVPTQCCFKSKNILVSTNSSGHLIFHDIMMGSKEKAPLIIEGHNEQIWSLLEYQEQFITAGKDGNLVFWMDNMEAVNQEKINRRESAIKFEQALSNCISNGDIVKAVNLSLKLKKPQHCYNQLVLAQQENKLESILDNVKKSLLPRLLEYVKKWNTMSRQLVVAQLVQNYVFSKNLIPNLNANDLQGLLIYNEKHMSRICTLYNKLAIVDNLLQE